MFKQSLAIALYSTGLFVVLFFAVSEYPWWTIILAGLGNLVMVFAIEYMVSRKFRKVLENGK